MAACGCASGCGCLIVAGDGVTVTGTGSIANPTVISITAASPENCDVIAECLGDHVDPTLTFDGTGKIAGVKISSTAGNTTSSTGAGLLTNSGCTGCGSKVTVETLPAGGIILTDHYFAARLDSRTAADLAFALWPRIKGYSFNLVTLPDGTFGAITNDLPVWNQSVTPSSGSIFWPYAGQLNLQPYNPEPNGYYDFYGDDLPRYPVSFTKLLTELGGRVLLSTYLQDTLTNLDSALALVTMYGLKRSVVWQFLDYQYARAITWAASGGVSMIYLADPAAHPPAALVADGVTWLLISAELSDATILSYTARPELTVLGQYATQPQLARLRSLGVKGASGPDGVWAAGPWHGYDYRTAVAPYPQRRFWPGGWAQPGAAAKGTFEATASVVTGKTEIFHRLPDEAANFMLLQGWGCPVPDANNLLIGGFFTSGLAV